MCAVGKHVIRRDFADRKIGSRLKEGERLFYAFTVKFQGRASGFVPLTFQPSIGSVLSQTPAADPFAGDQFMQPIQGTGNLADRSLLSDLFLVFSGNSQGQALIVGAGTDTMLPAVLISEEGSPDPGTTPA